jgi:hypothetical protein
MALRRLRGLNGTVVRGSQGEGDQSGSRPARLLLGDLDERLLLRAPALVHLAAGDFVCGRIHEAKLADRKLVVSIADRRSEGSALHGAEGVDVAGAGVGIEDGAGLVVGEVGEGLFMLRLGEEQAGQRIAGKFIEETRAGFCCTRANSICNVCGSHGQALAQVIRVELRDREDANAALVAPWLAGEPVAGALGGRSECGIEDGE